MGHCNGSVNAVSILKAAAALLLTGETMGEVLKDEVNSHMTVL